MYNNYRWKKGIPVGIKGDETRYLFKIVSDPYQKQIAVEKYRDGKFESIIYDSRLLDFRLLLPQEQIGWEKIPLSDTECLIKDQYDRVAYLERHQFEEGKCRSCMLYSPHQILLAQTKVFYESLGDPYNGVILYDRSGRPVFCKKYAVADGQFTSLLEDNWVITQQ